MVLGPAGNVAVDVAVELEPPGDARNDERLEGAEDGGAADAGVMSVQPPIEILSGHLASGGAQRVGDREALARHALAGLAQAVGGRPAGQCPPTAAANIENA